MDLILGIVSIVVIVAFAIGRARSERLSEVKRRLLGKPRAFYWE